MGHYRVTGGNDLLGRDSIGVAAATMTNAPFKIPAPPHPASALPSINIIDDCAAPQTKDPATKMRKAEMNMFWEWRFSPNLSIKDGSVPSNYKTDKAFQREAAMLI